MDDNEESKFLCSAQVLHFSPGSHISLLPVKVEMDGDGEMNVRYVGLEALLKGSDLGSEWVDVRCKEGNRVGVENGLR